MLFLPDLQGLEPDLHGRTLEQKGTKILLEQLLNTTEDLLTYDVKGKPFLKNRPEHISISHSHDYLVILMNKAANTGVDIELIRDKVISIRHKFLSETELLFCGDNTECHIRFWAAKEALYKWYGKKELDFKTHLQVIPSEQNNLFEGHILKGELSHRFQLASEKIDAYILVYLLHEIC